MFTWRESRPCRWCYQRWALHNILCCSFTWWLPIASEREHRCAGHSGRHSSPMDPSLTLFSLNTSTFNSRSSNKKWRFQPKLTVKSVYFYKWRYTSCLDKTSQKKHKYVWDKYCGLHLYIRCTRPNIKHSFWLRFVYSLHQWAHVEATFVWYGSNNLSKKLANQISRGEKNFWILFESW